MTRDVIDAADEVIEAERVRGVARAQAALAGEGAAACVDCDDEIAGERRAAMPSAVRCAACAAELEARRRVRSMRGGCLRSGG